MEFTHIAIGILVIFILFYMWTSVKKPMKKPNSNHSPPVKKDNTRAELTKRIIRRFNDGT